MMSECAPSESACACAEHRRLPTADGDGPHAGPHAGAHGRRGTADLGTAGRRKSVMPPEAHGVLSSHARRGSVLPSPAHRGAQPSTSPRAVVALSHDEDASFVQKSSFRSCTTAHEADDAAEAEPME
eukprot:4556944-Prymnesium_polylepis.1